VPLVLQAIVRSVDVQLGQILSYITTCVYASALCAPHTVHSLRPPCQFRVQLADEGSNLQVQQRGPRLKANLRSYRRAGGHCALFTCAAP